MSEAEKVRELFAAAQHRVPLAFRPAVGPALTQIGAEVAGVVSRLETRVKLLEVYVSKTDEDSWKYGITEGENHAETS